MAYGDKRVVGNVGQWTDGEILWDCGDWTRHCGAVGIYSNVVGLWRCEVTLWSSEHMTENIYLLNESPDYIRW